MANEIYLMSQNYFATLNVNNMKGTKLKKAFPSINGLILMFGNAGSEPFE